MKNLGICITLCFMTVVSLNAAAAGFNDNANGTVTDFATGLVWQQSDAHNDTTRNQSAASSYCESLRLAGKSDWRLPLVKELTSILDIRRTNPAADLQMFPGTVSALHWTATRSTTGNWHTVEFSGGSAGLHSRLNLLYVRCVRG
jgi:hypothetical protein